MERILYISMIIVLIIVIIGVVVYFLLKQKPQQNHYQDGFYIEEHPYTQEKSKIHYYKKPILTPTEKQYYKTIIQIIDGKYKVYPQVSLSSIIKKEPETKYANELYRVIDIGIFTEDYYPILLIEINDETHNTPQRKERDKKVKELCDQAGIRLISFWTSYGVNKEYIRKKIAEYCTEIKA